MRGLVFHLFSCSTLFAQWIVISVNLIKEISTVSHEKCQIRALKKATTLLPFLCLYSLDVCKMRYLHVHNRRTTQLYTEIWGQTAYLEQNLASNVNETLIADLIFIIFGGRRKEPILMLCSEKGCEYNLKHWHRGF